MNSFEIDLTIPDFLRVDAAEAARRSAWNAAHPILQTDFSGQTEVARREVDEARERMKAEEKERERERLQALADRKREEARAKAPQQFAKRLPGMIWNPRYGKWVLPHFMSQTKYERLMREMPSEAHRAALVRLHGSGHGASLDVGGSPACAIKDAMKVGPAPAGVPAGSRSAGKSAGRVRVPSGPRGASPAPTTAKDSLSTTKPTKPSGKAGDWKPRVITLLSRPEGATLAEVGAQEGWLEHSASARLSGIRKERIITATVEERGRVYRVAA